MSGVMYLVQHGNEMIEMRESRYSSEDLLQSLLEDHPNLLAGDQMNERAPRRWLLISREASVPDGEEAEGRWSEEFIQLLDWIASNIREAREAPVAAG